MTDTVKKSDFEPIATTLWEDCTEEQQGAVMTWKASEQIERENRATMQTLFAEGFEPATGKVIKVSPKFRKNDAGEYECYQVVTGEVPERKPKASKAKPTMTVAEAMAAYNATRGAKAGTTASRAIPLQSKLIKAAK